MPTLDWIGKAKVVSHHQEVPFRVLEKQYTCGGDSGENRIIHGDNLEALKALLPQYAGKIKCIYIDPPYNTGNEGWVYNDNVNDPKIKKRNLLPRTKDADSNYSNPDHDPRGVWTSNAIQARNYYASGHYEIIGPTGKVFLPPAGTSWRISEETFDELVKDNRIWWGQNKDSVPRIKKFLNEAKQGIVPTTLWSYQFAGQNADAKLEIRSIFNDEPNIFNTPKPTRLIERILQIASDPDSIILDSFAGSGTTAHAVLNMNKADGGNRRFILIEMEDYAERITAGRVKRVIDGYGEGKGAVEGTGGGFSYYELGQPLLLGDCLNEAVGTEKIREYIWFMETRTPYVPPAGGHPYCLGQHGGAGYYFCYERDAVTVLDYAFLSTLKEEADAMVIYADRCTISADQLARMGIVFKKIPRDIARL